MKPISFINRESNHFAPDRRIAVMLTILMAFSAVVLIQLFRRSVLQSGLAEAKAEAQQTVQVKLNPFRGSILVKDKDSTATTPIALNEPQSTVNVVPNQVKDAKMVAQKLSPLIGMDEAALFDLINNKKTYIPPVAKKLSLEVGQQIIAMHLNGVTVSIDGYRTYPEGQLASQLLGFVNAEGNGQYGVEGYYNNQLQGFIGSIFGKKDGWGNTYIDQESVTNNKGASIVLTIDRDVQATVEQLLQKYVDEFKAKSGSVVIVEPQSGKIIAMASMPTYDPNNYNLVKSDQQNVFQNLNVSRTFEPGSVMKTISIAGALDSGKVPIDYTGNYGSSVNVDGFEIHTADNKSYGHETVADILVNSDNVAMVDISSKMGRELLNDYMNRFGFGSKTGIDLDSEVAGSFPALKNWRSTNLATISFGQGISVTPLQMAMAYSAIANNGKLMKPYVVGEIDYSDGRVDKTKAQTVRQVVGSSVVQQVTDMMVQVVDRGHGKRAGVTGYKVAGKTGTAQIANPDGPGYVEGKNNGSFAGFAPATDPKFAMLVTIEEPQGVQFAESSAAPLWGDIAKYLLKDYYRVAPNGG
ncbi:MAG: penicillin-binding protein 2 [Patescibacteria group bacterium]|jgi:cell division protein FtsI/penicillin-binding protein 2